MLNISGVNVGIKLDIKQACNTMSLKYILEVLKAFAILVINFGVGFQRFSTLLAICCLFYLMALMWDSFLVVEVLDKVTYSLLYSQRFSQPLLFNMAYIGDLMPQALT